MEWCIDVIVNAYSSRILSSAYSLIIFVSLHLRNFLPQIGEQPLHFYSVSMCPRSVETFGIIIFMKLMKYEVAFNREFEPFQDNFFSYLRAQKMPSKRKVTISLKLKTIVFQSKKIKEFDNIIYPLRSAIRWCLGTILTMGEWMRYGKILISQLSHYDVIGSTIRYANLTMMIVQTQTVDIFIVYAFKSHQLGYIFISTRRQLKYCVAVGHICGTAIVIETKSKVWKWKWHLPDEREISNEIGQLKKHEAVPGIFFFFILLEWNALNFVWAHAARTVCVCHISLTLACKLNAEWLMKPAAATVRTKFSHKRCANRRQNELLSGIERLTATVTRQTQQKW